MRKTELADPSGRSDSDGSVYGASFDPDSEPVSDAVVWVLTEITDQEADELDPIGSVVDPIVLNALFRRRRQPIEVRFAYNGHKIAVESSGEIIVQLHGEETQ